MDQQRVNFRPGQSAGGRPNHYNGTHPEGVALQEEKASTRARAGSPKGGERQVLKGLFMEKWLCWSSMGVAGLLFLLFLLDLILQMPFSGISPTVDIFGIVASVIVLYLAWDAFKDLR